MKSAAELLARVRADLARIDLIVLDLRLPHAGGVDWSASIRKLDDGKLPILVFSGTIATAEEVRDLAALGVSGYVNEYSAVQHILPSLAPHLFPDNFNRRGSPRVVLGIPVAYRFGNTIAAALTLNLSKGGLAIRTMSPLEQDAKVRVRFRLPGSRRDIEAESRIAWSDHRVGMGLQFEKVDPGDQARDRRVRRSAFLHEPKGLSADGCDHSRSNRRAFAITTSERLCRPRRPSRASRRRRAPSRETRPSAPARTRCSRGCCARSRG